MSEEGLDSRYNVELLEGEVGIREVEGAGFGWWGLVEKLCGGGCGENVEGYSNSRGV